MAIKYDFPTNYKEKIMEVDRLLEKKYIDQAICMLEDWLENVGKYSVDCEKEIQKKLLGCYIAIREFEVCNEIIAYLRGLGCLDLTLAAYDIVISLILNKEEEVTAKKRQYREELSLSIFASKNLMELAFQLKSIYEEEWLAEVDNVFKSLLQAKSFEEKINVLANLQDIESEYFQFYKNTMEQFFEQETFSIVRTMVFELCTEKGLELELSFYWMGRMKKLTTDKECLLSFYEVIEQGRRELSKLEMDEMSYHFLEQQLMMFFQFIFPFYENIDFDTLVHELKNQHELDNVGNKGGGLTGEENKREITLEKIKEYQLSLSLLI